MVIKTFVIAVFCVTSLNLADLAAQDDACTRRTVAVSVVDSAWKRVPNLGAASFRGKLGGRGVQVLSVADDTNPRRIVLVFDASGSMGAPSGQWEIEKSLSEYLIQFGPRESSIAEVAFSTSVIDSEAFAQDSPTLWKNLHALVNACERHRIFGQTALWDALVSARGLLGVPNRGDVICTFTDAMDNKSRTQPKELQEELLRAGVRLFGVVLEIEVSSRARTPEEDTRGYFRSMVLATGGNVLVLPLAFSSPTHLHVDAKAAMGSLGPTVDRFYQQMGEFYRVDVKLPEAPDKPTKWKLEVVDGRGKPMRGVEVHYPQELMPCASARL